MFRKVLLLALVLSAPVALLVGCAAGPARSPAPGPDWSRGVQVGECSVNEAVALYPEPDGQRVHLAWGRVSQDGDRIEYLQVSASGAILSKVDLPFVVRSPRQVHLVPDGSGGLVICYLSGISTGRRVYAAHLSGSGEVLAEPLPVSGDELEADDFTAVAGPAGVDIFWSNHGHGTSGLYHAELDQSGRLVQPSKLLFAAGISPDVQAGSDGLLHLAWIHEPGYFEEHVYYAAFDRARRELVSPVELAYFALGPKATRFGPVLALSKDQAHVAWAWEFLAATAGAAAGEGECRYVSFPMGQAAGARPAPLTLPPSVRPAYQPAQGAFAYTRLARAGSDASGLVYMPNAAGGEHDEAALAVVYEVATRNSSRLQAAVVYLAEDGIKGYQIAGRSTTNIVRPVLAADRQRQLHLVWLELAGFHRYRVYYASTSETARAALGRLGRDDLVSAAYTAVWGLVQAASMFPIGFVWLVVPFAWVMGYYLVKVEGDLERLGPRIALGIAIALYLFCKFLLMPANFIAAAPFLDRLPPGVADIYMMALPVAIFLVALGALRLYTRRSESRTLLFGYLVFGATDCVLTFLLYAPGVLG